MGVGYLGSLHAKRLHEIPEAELVGVYDILPERSKEIAERYSTVAFPSLDSLLNEVEAAVIATPTKTHYDIARECILRSKHVFVEKPLTDSVETSKEIRDLAKKFGVKVQVGHIERFNPAFIAAQRYIEGKVYFIESVRMSVYDPRGTDVDVILDMMIHDIDLTLSLMKEDPIIISAVGIPVVTDDIDIANVRLEFPSGSVANLTASRVSLEKMRKFRVFVKNRYISIDLYRKHVDIIQKEGKELMPYFPPIDTSKDSITLELEAFLRAVRGKSDVPVTSEDGCRNVEVAKKIKDKIYERISGFKI